MNNRNLTARFFIILLLALMILPESLLAIPAFARRHKVSCTTCHTAFPRLKDYGDEFAGNGFIMKEDENPRNYVRSGDELLWLNKDFPLAARMEAFANYDGAKSVESDLQAPWGIKLLSGGTLYHNVGYYFYFYMSERGEVAGVEDAYIHFDNVGGSELDVMVGQFQTSDPLMKRELRLTYEDYEIYKTRIGLSNNNLAYDRGVMLVYGFPELGTDLVGMIVNGNGKPEAVDRRMDQDNAKNLGFRIAQGLGDNLSLGAFYYMGSEESSGEQNKITYYGPDLGLSAGPLDITAQLLYRLDSNPNFGAADTDEETTGIIVEAVYGPQLDMSRWYLTALYNLVDSSVDAADYQTATLSYTYQMARNLRLLTEYTYQVEAEQHRFIFGVISAF